VLRQGELQQKQRLENNDMEISYVNCQDADTPD